MYMVFNWNRRKVLGKPINMQQSDMLTPIPEDMEGLQVQILSLVVKVRLGPVL